MPLVSIVIPAHNSACFIAETIESVLHQSVKNIEVIVVNDGSTDDTARIARAFGHPVCVIEQSNAGVCVARNRGIKEARGEFIAFLDHDDVWFPDKLAHQLNAFAEWPEVDVVFTNFLLWREDIATRTFPTTQTFLAHAAPQGIDLELSGWIYHQMLLDSQVLTSSALVRTKIVVAAGGYDESLPFSEDWDIWLRLSRTCQFLKLREASTLYRQHATQGSRVTRKIDYRSQLIDNAARRWGLCSPDGRCVTPSRFRRQLAKYIADFGLGHLSDGVGAERTIAAKSFVKSWLADPLYWRAISYLAAMVLGWRPQQ